MIWKEAQDLFPRKVLMDDHYGGTSVDRPKLNSKSLTHVRLACRESNHVFLYNYRRCFPGYDDTGSIPTSIVYFNPYIDTLALVYGLDSLGWITNAFPDDMSKIKRIQISTWNQSDESCLPINLSRLNSKACITVRPDVGYTKSLQFAAASDEGDSDDFSEENYGSRIIYNLLVLREQIMRSQDPNKPYNGPKLAGVFSRVDYDLLESDFCLQKLANISLSGETHFYMQTMADLSSLRWGRVKTYEEVLAEQQAGKGRSLVDWTGEDSWEYQKDEFGNKIKYTGPIPQNQELYSRQRLEGLRDVFTRMFRKNEFPASCK